MTDIELGETYGADDLPDSELTNSGKLDQYNEDTFIGVFNGRVYEFEPMYRCKAIQEVDDRGDPHYVEHLYEDLGDTDE